MYILPFFTDTIHKCRLKGHFRMNKHRKSLYRKTALCAAAALPILFFLIWAIRCAREPSAVYTGAEDNNSIYYSSNPYASQENEASAPINSKTVKIYTVRIQDGRISVFEENGTAPLYTIDTPPSRLPYADRLLLEAGIRASSFEEACRLIEDYE